MERQSTLRTGPRVSVAARPGQPTDERRPARDTSASPQKQALALNPTQKRKGRREGKITFKKNKAGQLALPDFKTYHKATVIKTVWRKYRPRDNQKPEIHLHIYSRGWYTRGQDDWERTPSATNGARTRYSQAK